jgi:DNA-binding helix-hairpin-helix protein with protein kinase domain
LRIPDPGSCAVHAQPLPSSIPGKGKATLYKLVVIVLSIAAVAAAPGIWFLGVLAGVVGWTVAGRIGASARAAEWAKRRRALETVGKEYGRIVEIAKQEAGPEGFRARLGELAKLREELENLPRAENQEIDRLRFTARERQKQKFLDKCFIDSASIAGVGPARKAALRSFGIETAADVTRDRVMHVRGFGESLTRAVLDWKAGCAREFTFNPAHAVSQADRDTVRAKFAARRVQLERALTAAPEELQQLRKRAAAHRPALMAQMENAARKLAQAQADFSILQA